MIVLKIVIFFIIWGAFSSLWATDYPHIEKEFFSGGSVKKETIHASVTQYTVKEFSELGFLLVHENFLNSKLHGKCYYFSEDGKPISVVVYENGNPKQTIQYSELYQKANSFLDAASEGNPLRAENIQRKILPALAWALAHAVELGIGFLVLGFLYFLFIFHRPDHKAYFKYAKAQTHFTVEGELLSSPPRKVILPLNFYLQSILFLFTIGFMSYISKSQPKALFIALAVAGFAVYALSRVYTKIKLLKYGTVVPAEIMGIEYVRKVGSSKIILNLKYDRNAKTFEFKSTLPMPKKSYSVGDKVSLLVSDDHKYLVYGFSDYKIKSA